MRPCPKEHLYVTPRPSVYRAHVGFSFQSKPPPRGEAWTRQTATRLQCASGARTTLRVVTCDPGATPKAKVQSRECSQGRLVQRAAVLMTQRPPWWGPRGGHPAVRTMLAAGRARDARAGPCSGHGALSSGPRGACHLLARLAAHEWAGVWTPLAFPGATVTDALPFPPDADASHGR